MDERVALSPGAMLKLNTHTGYAPFIIQREVGRGGSCIVYDASYKDHLGNFKLVRIKECYPHALHITRNNDGELTADSRDANGFAAAKKRMRDAYQRNHNLFCIGGLTNAIANTSDIYDANGTIYIVSVYMNGRTFADFHGDTLHDCVSLLISAARVLERIHEAGYLYLDLKPDNILTLEGSLDLVQLFDFDSMISMKELSAAIQANDPCGLRPTCTRGYAPLEQKAGKLRQLGQHSDIYSLGAVLFYALWHRAPSAFDCDPETVYDYTHMTYAEKQYQDRLFPAITAFMHRTLASYHADRYRSAEEAIRQLQIIRDLSDERKPWILSTPISKPVFFTGRAAELSALDRLLHIPNQHIFNLYGMGGIGKSTLARFYVSMHRTAYDAVLWLYANGNAVQLICDDNSVHINTIRRMNDEPLQDYLDRKLQVLKEIAAEQHVLAVVDDVRPEALHDLRPLLDIGWQLLLISRPMLAEGQFLALGIAEMPPDALVQLFQRFAHVEMNSPEDTIDYSIIANAVCGHTLTMELLGRQIARSYLTLHAAARLVKNAGLDGLPKERIDYIHDQDVLMTPLHSILDRLVEIDRFSDDEKRMLQILSVFEQPGIRATLFRELAALPNLEMINRLEADGWLQIVSGRIHLHPMLQQYIGAWPWDPAARDALDGVMQRLHHRINPLEAQPDLDKQFPDDYAQLYALLDIAEQLLPHANPRTPASQLLLFRVLMDAPVDADETIAGRMLQLLACADGLPAACVLRLYETAAFMLGRLECYADAHSVLKAMKGYLKSHPSHYYASRYHHAAAVILNNQYGWKKARSCLKHENAAIREARCSSHPDAPNQLAAALLGKAQTLLEPKRKLPLCGQMILEAEGLLQSLPYGYAHYHFDCVAAMYFAIVGDADTSIQHLQRATAQAEYTQDSPLAMIDHMLDEAAVVYIQLGRFDDAIAMVSQAIAICDAHAKALRYQEARSDALRFLEKIRAMQKDSIGTKAKHVPKQ